MRFAAFMGIIVRMFSHKLFITSAVTHTAQLVPMSSFTLGTYNLKEYLQISLKLFVIPASTFHDTSQVIIV